MKDKTYFTSYDVWEYITKTTPDGNKELPFTIIRDVDLSEFKHKFKGYMTSPLANHDGVSYAAKSAKFFDVEGLHIFLNTVPDSSLILYQSKIVYTMVTSTYKSNTFEQEECEPHIQSHVLFRYCEAT